MSDKKVELDLIDELELSGLRPGRDPYSRLTLAELTAQRPNEAVEIIAELSDPAEQRSALRFVLRGLTVEKAVAKVVLDREIVKRIRDQQRAEKELRESLGMTSEEFEQTKRYLKRK